MYKNEIKLDKTTFPQDGQHVRFEIREQSDLTGYYDAESEQILETPEGGDFWDMWHVESWEPIN
jgi:hypothetical protein